MKLFKIILFISIFSIPVYLVVINLNKNEDKNWQTYYKSETGLNVYKTTEREKKKVKISNKKEDQNILRAPASIPRPIDKKTKREILGKINDRTTYTNSPNPDWKKLYANDLLNKLGEDSKVFIKKNSGIIRVIANKATYIEQVQVTIQSDPNLPANSFEAQVDAQTGKQLTVWNRTNFENKKNSFSIKMKLDP
ncbi:putative membrane protein [Halobacteriovorax marinus SJ]|uniref:Membrane protein n=1 Tax=Halobacteriovorax marinus (strain ATCC BAA-682 / DSM 15412 / SJ) TaxID=862908 RepID=E1X2M4_HALMS|nr:hypothetical protein [Halobacteriovorax marinus]CBW26791.1 putative membrane protein [Halobacteriovorax marinus SJ]